jgi:hypothetical protein
MAEENEIGLFRVAAAGRVNGGSGSSGGVVGKGSGRAKEQEAKGRVGSREREQSRKRAGEQRAKQCEGECRVDGDGRKDTREVGAATWE